MAVLPSDLELLERARSGDLAPLARNPQAVLEAIERFASAGDAAAALELFARGWRAAWLKDGELQAGRRAAATALAAPGAQAVAPWRCRVLYADGIFAFRLGDQAGSRERNEEALAVARAARDARGECEALTGLARVALRDGDYAQVVALAMQGRELARRSGDPSLEAAPLHLHAAGVRLMKDYAEARSLYERSLELNQRLQASGWIDMERHNLGWVCLHLGDVDGAEAHFGRLPAPAAGDAHALAWQALNRAGIECARGRLDAARRSFAAGARALQELHARPDPDDQSELDWLTDRLGPG